MSFKDNLETDLEEVFFNPEELADEHEINGVSCLCVLDTSDHLSDNATFTVHSRNMQYKSETLQLGDRVLFIQKKYVEKQPKVGEYFYIDEDTYQVVDVTDAWGMYQIHLRDISE